MIYPEGSTPLASDSTQRWLNKIVMMGGGTAGPPTPGDVRITDEGDPRVTDDGDTRVTA
jgi:hypothetical protein